MHPSIEKDSEALQEAACRFGPVRACHLERSAYAWQRRSARRFLCNVSALVVSLDSGGVLCSRVKEASDLSRVCRP